MGTTIGPDQIRFSRVGAETLVGTVQMETVLAGLYERGPRADYAAHCHISRPRVYARTTVSKS